MAVGCAGLPQTLVAFDVGGIRNGTPRQPSCVPHSGGVRILVWQATGTWQVPDAFAVDRGHNHANR